jgi:Xaa-Pro aminopeptidase
MPTSRRQFLKVSAATAAAAGCASPRRRFRWPDLPGAPRIEGPYRLPVEWHKGRIADLQRRLAAKGIDGMLFEDRWNVIYFTGLFHTSTERTFSLFVPTIGEPVFFVPGLDRDLVSSWWVKDFEWYFDFHHSGPFGQVAWSAGPKADLRKWILEGLKKRGFGASRIAIEKKIHPDDLAKWQETVPGTTFVSEERIPIEMRLVKTPEEIDLGRKAIALHDRMLEFARGLILDHGTDLHDYDVAVETERFAVEALLPAVNPSGRPHDAVGISLGFGCRAGVATAYPHPNQFYYHRIAPGDAIQIAAVILIGGCGGEGYRALQTEPADEPRRRMWETHTEMTLLQAEVSKAGVRCNEVAEQVLAVARREGMERFVYHRPAHGQGWEGHQEPYIALGDDTVLEEGMTFSNEPGLYDPEGGYGYNHSNWLRIGKERGERLNQTPLTKEWCWLRL